MRLEPLVPIEDSGSREVERNAVVSLDHPRPIATRYTMRRMAIACRSCGQCDWNVLDHRESANLNLAERLKEEVRHCAPLDERNETKECESRCDERRFDDNGSDASVLITVAVAGHGRQDRATIVEQPSTDRDGDDCAEGKRGGKERNDPVHV